ncbi:MAG: hypothetical protein LR017_04030, partial [Candidatus Pacebacteria bacterium]|nr:hypothetical protein [Candidatus Paceibacterota bacterium]
TAFTAEISPSNQKRIRAVIREAKIWRNTKLEPADIANQFNGSFAVFFCFQAASSLLSGGYTKKCKNRVAKK